jgi:hypothetical protein
MPLIYLSFTKLTAFPPNIKSDILWLQKCCVLARNILPVLVSVAAETPDKFNPLTPNDPYRGRTAPLTSKRCILYIYSTNIGTEYFKHCIYSPFFVSLQNAVCFIILTYLVPVLFTFYIQNVLKLKKIIPALKGCTASHPENQQSLLRESKISQKTIFCSVSYRRPYLIVPLRHIYASKTEC